MKLIQFLMKYKIGAGGGLLYGIIGFVFLYALGLCGTSEGLCVVFSPLAFHKDVVEITAASLATPFFLIFLNSIIFAFEGAAIEMLVRKP